MSVEAMSSMLWQSTVDKVVAATFIDKLVRGLLLVRLPMTTRSAKIVKIIRPMHRNDYFVEVPHQTENVTKIVALVRSCLFEHVCYHSRPKMVQIYMAGYMNTVVRRAKRYLRVR